MNKKDLEEMGAIGLNRNLPEYVIDYLNWDN